MGQTYHPRMARGRGQFSIDRIPYVIEQALPLLKDFKNIILVEANDPVAFFAYPNKPSKLKPEGCEVQRLTAWGENSVAALEALADALSAGPQDVKPQKLVEIAKPTGPLTHASIAQALAMAIPENAIVVDESITTGRGFFPPTASANPHDWLQNMGGSIGFSTPVATGAAIACPDRKVICMVGDGSAMYTIQSLWTQARESLNVVTIVFANRIYQILRGEFDGVGAGEPGQRALDMLKIDRPTIDFVSLARGIGKKTFLEVIGTAAHEVRRQVFFAASSSSFLISLFSSAARGGPPLPAHGLTVAFRVSGSLSCSPCWRRPCCARCCSKTTCGNRAIRHSTLFRSATPARSTLVFDHLNLTLGLGAAAGGADAVPVHAVGFLIFGPTCRRHRQSPPTCTSGGRSPHQASRCSKPPATYRGGRLPKVSTGNRTRGPLLLIAGATTNGSGSDHQIDPQAVPQVTGDHRPAGVRRPGPLTDHRPRLA